MKIVIGIVSFVIGFAAACLTVKNRVVPTTSEIAGNMAKEGVEKGIVKIKEKWADREESRNAVQKKQIEVLTDYALETTQVLKWVKKVLGPEHQDEYSKKVEKVQEKWTIVKSLN